MEVLEIVLVKGAELYPVKYWYGFSLNYVQFYLYVFHCFVLDYFGSMHAFVHMLCVCMCVYVCVCVRAFANKCVFVLKCVLFVCGRGGYVFMFVSELFCIPYMFAYIFIRCSCTCLNCLIVRVCFGAFIYIKLILLLQYACVSVCVRARACVCVYVWDYLNSVCLLYLYFSQYLLAGEPLGDCT